MEQYQTLDEISRRGYPATRVELVHYYRYYICDTGSPLVTDVMSGRELRRLVFIGAYRQRYTTRTTRGRVVRKIAVAVGVSWSSGFRYARQFDKTRKRKVK